MRKPAFCICENKDADQLRGNRKADQRLCFRYTDSTIPLLSKSEISSLWSSSVAVQPGLCGTWSETPKTGFLRTRLILLVTFTCVCRSESPTGLMLFVFTYSTLNKASMSIITGVGAKKKEKRNFFVKLNDFGNTIVLVI